MNYYDACFSSYYITQITIIERYLKREGNIIIIIIIIILYSQIGTTETTNKVAIVYYTK